MVKYLPILFVILAACSKETAETGTDSVSYNIDAGRISASGVSSGAYMAGQMHLAHSAIINGVAVVSGGPFYCAMGELTRGLGPCMKGDGLDLEPLIDYAQQAAQAGKIDDLANLKDDRVYTFHGTLDALVHASVTDSAAAMYAKLISEDAITRVRDVAVIHGWPTLATGLPCDTFGAPYLNACDYDTAGEIFKTLYGELNARTVASGQLLTIAQPGFEAAQMLQQAYLYVPPSCADGAVCGVHVAVHGCAQSSDYVGDAFATGSGFNEWADANNLLVLYPQVASSKFAPMNPNGCWDWWGYTGENYATRDGAQIRVIKATLDALAGQSL